MSLVRKVNKKGWGVDGGGSHTYTAVLHVIYRIRIGFHAKSGNKHHNVLGVMSAVEQNATSSHDFLSPRPPTAF